MNLKVISSVLIKGEAYPRNYIIFMSATKRYLKYYDNDRILIYQTVTFISENRSRRC